ncbi:Imm51 family immunity protein [Streptococcus mitis]|nr:Imm51 family immunity protein [Streptococcus mitis]MCY7169950.1 immunity 51 family protein [Streptococcus mitis]
MFDTREEEGFEGNGYDWESLALVFLEEKMPELSDAIYFDPEGSMFCAY